MIKTHVGGETDMRAVKTISLTIAILGLITAIVVLLTEVIKLKRELPSETPTIVVVTNTVPSSNLASATAESTDWAFTLEKRFPAGFWSNGTHSYSFAWTCPNEAPDSVTRSFTVSDSFQPITGDVYLRWSSLVIGNPWGDVVEGINPSQATIAAIAWKTITKSEADWRAANCTGTISWDGGTEEPLISHVPFQH
jgi:hypothetical protein